MSRRLFCFTISILLFTALFHCSKDGNSKDPGGTPMGTITVTSTAFKEGEMIPARYTCDDRDVSPQLSWSNVPAGAKSIALICDDPDAPAGTWVHWVVFNIPPTAKELIEGVGALPAGAKQGINDFRKLDYGGPCPPGGTHRYYFKIYALDAVIDLKEGASKSALLKAMEGRILAQGQLMGKYKRR
ncbi:MAG: YbhB/YbcL family Raf kinase inhibitor-like protein [Spirochaetes bacterium]|nr:YbhB/YbcL family Raf kinase inhibitor-like protein [Spirochaetota bacterium]